MNIAHGGQILVSHAVAELVRDRFPAEISLRDLGTVRLRDLSAPERVWQVILPALRQDFPALRSLEATPNNLPQQATSFVGREREVAEVKKLLQSAALVTLLGVGGIGKTRLSLQVATDLSTTIRMACGSWSWPRSPTSGSFRRRWPAWSASRRKWGAR